MKCPHCEKEIPGVPCPKCGETILETANYCMACGARLKEGLKEPPPRDDRVDDDSEFDFDDRILCPDGTCTGIIIDGKCSECDRAVGDDGEFIEQDTDPVVEKEPSDTEIETKKGD